jgi:hypothetical protein
MTENTRPDYLTYASQYVDPTTGVRNRKLRPPRSKRSVDKVTLSTKDKPTPISMPIKRSPLWVEPPVRSESEKP